MNTGITYIAYPEKINPAIKVLLSSGYSINGAATEMMERGGNGFIQKPFNMKGLAQKTREVLYEERPLKHYLLHFLRQMLEQYQTDRSH